MDGSVEGSLQVGTHRIVYVSGMSIEQNVATSQTPAPADASLAQAELIICPRIGINLRQIRDRVKVQNPQNHCV